MSEIKQLRDLMESFNEDRNEADKYSLKVMGDMVHIMFEYHDMAELEIDSWKKLLGDWQAMQGQNSVAEGAFKELDIGHQESEWDYDIAGDVFVLLRNDGSGPEREIAQIPIDEWNTIIQHYTSSQNSRSRA